MPQVFATRSVEDNEEQINLRARLEGEGEHEGLIGDLVESVEPGGEMFGKSYEEWGVIADTTGVAEVDA